MERDLEISAIITTYKREWAKVAAAIHSVFVQDYPVKEIVIVDDNPEGNVYSAQIFENIKILNEENNSSLPIIVYVTSGINQGAAEARNIGAASAKYEYIAFLDDDDEWLPCHTRFLADIMKKDSSVSIAYGVGFEKNDETGEKSLNWQCEHFNECPSIWEILENDYIGPPHVLMKKDVFLEAGGFAPLPAYEDYELWIRMIKKGYVAKGIRKPVYVRHMDSTEHVSRNRKKCFHALTIIYAENKSDYDKCAAAKKQILWNISREGIFAHDIRAIPYIFEWGMMKIRRH